jgi:DNA polymerase-4
MGVKTGMAIWQALQVCPDLRTVHPRMDDYMQFSDFVRQIYGELTDRVEPFGLDECWLDLTGCVPSWDGGVAMIDRLRERVKYELGLSVSIGLSDNKIFAKLGSDIKKPDAYTLIPRQTFREIVWPLPAGDLLYVGRATTAKLRSKCIYTIGDIARTNERYLCSWFGKIGSMLHAFANGEDRSPVAPSGYESFAKSVGNSCTCPRDLCTDTDVRIILIALSESVGARMMESGVRARVIEFSYTDSDMVCFGSHQRKLRTATNVAKEIADVAFELFRELYGHWPKPLRHIGVRGSDLVSMDASVQLTLYPSTEQMLKLGELERSINYLRKRYGNKSIQRGIMYTDLQLSGIDAKKDHTVHPSGWFSGHAEVSIV